VDPAHLSQPVKARGYRSSPTKWRQCEVDKAFADGIGLQAANTGWTSQEKAIFSS
jgi:hypothetical protein